jgi:small subunit ribosomal protein S17
MERKKTESKSKNKTETLARAICNDRECNVHGDLKTRGRIFEGVVTRKFPRRIVIEFGRMIYIKKYERYAKSRTKIHARLPDCMKDSVNIGDYIRIQECRPLSKLIHFVVIEKVKSKEEKQ